MAGVIEHTVRVGPDSTNILAVRHATAQIAASSTAVEGDPVHVTWEQVLASAGAGRPSGYPGGQVI